jgi:hypothetical protein
LQALRHNPWFARPHDPAVPNGVFQVEEQPGSGAGIGVVNENSTLAEKRLKALQHNIDGGIQKRMAWCQQLRLRLTRDQGLVEGDTRISVEDGVASPDQAVALL